MCFIYLDYLESGDFKSTLSISFIVFAYDYLNRACAFYSMLYAIQITKSNLVNTSNTVIYR